ncbi:hypothetical protein O181_093377, partial [Austropuccinia psidii MF-1]|nr:hypothetical protein [Austropuccinia psidii MF-1]
MQLPPSKQQHLSSTTDLLVQCIGVKQLFKTATEIVADFLRTENRLLTDTHHEYILGYLKSEAASELAQSLKEGDYDDDPMAFWDLLDAYTSPRGVKLISGALGPSHAQLLSYLDVLFHGPGYPGVDDKLSSYLLDWWTTMADDLQDGVEEGLQEARQNLANA